MSEAEVEELECCGHTSDEAKQCVSYTSGNPHCMDWGRSKALSYFLYVTFIILYVAGLLSFCSVSSSKVQGYISRDCDHFFDFIISYHCC